MLSYLIRRLMYALLVLFAVSLLTFFMSTIAPGDQVESHMILDGEQIAYRNTSYAERARAYSRKAEQLGLDLPQFYIEIQPASFPDTLYRIRNREERQTMKTFLHRHGDWNLIASYRNSVLRQIEESMQTQSVNSEGTFTGDLEFLLTTSDTGRIRYLFGKLSDQDPNTSETSTSGLNAVKAAYIKMSEVRPGLWQLRPKIIWHGFQNQYNHWISKTLTGNFGVSLIDGRPVSSKIREALRWTLSINIAAILLAFGIGIPLGVVAAQKAGSKTDRVISALLFALFAVPSFWLAMLCIVFLTTSEYGSWLDWFPTGGVGVITSSMSPLKVLGIRMSHLALPVFCAMAGSLAYLTRQMRGSMLRELRQDYIRMVRAKGMSEQTVHWKHAFRNALFPMITIVGSAFPAAISGTIILEVIFSIPGMGRLLYMSILSKDWPVVYAMVLLAATLTIIGYFVSDVLYHKADPRVDLKLRKA